MLQLLKAKPAKPCKTGFPNHATRSDLVRYFLARPLLIAALSRMLMPLGQKSQGSQGFRKLPSYTDMLSRAPQTRISRQHAERSETLRNTTKAAVCRGLKKSLYSFGGFLILFLF